MKVATLDIGTNTVLLLIAELEQGLLTPIAERATITRLGQGVDKTRRLQPAAVERTLTSLREAALLIREHQVERLGAVGTSALRDAEGSKAFLDAAEQILGVRPVVISGEEEGRLTFGGALHGLAIKGHVVVFDVGGGSTEIAVGSCDPAPALHSSRSLDIGSVRLTERLLLSDPPTGREINQVREAVHNQLKSVERPSRSSRLVGVAGTVTQLAALDLGLSAYEPERVHGYVLTHSRLAPLTKLLCQLPIREKRQLRGMEPARADVVAAGALIVSSLLDWAEQGSLTVSDRGIRWGLALEMGAKRREMTR